MTIEWRDGDRQFHLASGTVSYVLRVLGDGSIGSLHVGAPLRLGRSYAHLGRAFDGFANRLDDPVALEYPVPGVGDFRSPALVIETADGARVVRPTYAGHKVLAGKPALPGLPATYAEADHEAETLVLHLADAASGVAVDLSYTIFEGRPVVARSARIRNDGSKPIQVEAALSASLDLPDRRWELITLSGAWARERHVIRQPLAPGRRSISSRRGASGHEHNPFLALARPETTEAQGEAIGLSLVYSGNFLGEAEVDLFGTTRVRLGIDPETFSWALAQGATFQVPEAVIAWSGDGLGGLSDAYHALYRERLARGRWRDQPRPILINNWEATYFAFDETRIVEIARSAKDLGVELFVLDDGWFGKRDDDTTSLGDWVVDRRKLPDGIDGLARKVTGLGLSFGLWIEPEMVSEESRLFAEHPDWAIGVPWQPRTPSRQQFVLDLSRREVVDHLFAALAEVLGSAPISYVKWDMNRNITEPYSVSLPPDRQGEFFHRYILGVYDLYERLTRAFPDVLFESCAGGGGRFDPGLLAFAPQGWTSDDTDAIERLRIQWGTSLAYPVSSMGAHVSAVPNHQVGRITPLATRAAVAFFGAFGYELDPTALTEPERAEIREQIRFFARWRPLFQFGRFVRLRSPFEGDGNVTAWMAVAADRQAAIAGWYQELNRPVPGPERLRFRGLDPSLSYRVSLWPEPQDGSVLDGATVRGGDELMAAGLVPAPSIRDAGGQGDFSARLFVLEAV
ncbi:MAG TPA: alpha-galactosidase [Clostridia bacterium]|nr:alpha-galactosidase [Clostridia bacterium]